MTISIEGAVAALKSKSVPGKGLGMSSYHKVEREYLGVSNPDIDDLTREWRKQCDLEGRLALASGLWETNSHEGRVAAAKLLTQARIRPDDSRAWELLKSWVADFDAWAIADHVSIAGQKRLVADPKRIDDLEAWTQSDHMWTKRAALVMTLPWARLRNPKPADIEIRERILGWAASYVPDQTWFIQKAIAWWLRDLSKKDPDRVRAFLDEHGDAMKPFAKKEAGRLLPAGPAD